MRRLLLVSRVPSGRHSSSSGRGGTSEAGTHDRLVLTGGGTRNGPFQRQRLPFSRSEAVKKSRAARFAARKAICFAASRQRCPSIASSTRLASDLFSLTNRATLDFFTASRDDRE